MGKTKNYEKDLIEEYNKYAKTRCVCCNERLSDQDIESHLTEMATLEQPPAWENRCPWCGKETELYVESIEQYIEGEGYEMEDCIKKEEQ